MDDAHDTDPWSALLEHEVRDAFRRFPRPPDAAFTAWVEQKRWQVIRGCGPLTADQPPRLTSKHQAALDGLEAAVARCIDERVWERYAAR